MSLSCVTENGFNLTQFKIDKNGFKKVKLDVLSPGSWSSGDRAVATSLPGSLFFLYSWERGRTGNEAGVVILVVLFEQHPPTLVT